MNVEIKIIKPLNVDGIDNFMDGIVYGATRITKDFTNSENRFPRRTGNLQITSMAQPIRKSGKYSYSLDVPYGVEYAGFVWQMKDVHWTNENTYPQWYETMFRNKKELIISSAINQSKGWLK